MRTDTRTMPLEDVLELWSGDFDKPLKYVLVDDMYADNCWHSEDGWFSCKEFIEYLASRMMEFGWDGPPTCIIGRSFQDGHHRVLAAKRTGIISAIPYTDDMRESGEHNNQW